MSMLFINQKDLDDLREEIDEEFGLKPSKNNSKNNKEKKETVEDRIINRCKKVEKYCSSAIDLLPYYGAAKKAIECKTGKDYITDEELTLSERINRGYEVASGIKDTLADAFGLKFPDVPKKVELVKQIVEIIGEDLKKEKGREPDSSKNKPKNKSRSKSRSRKRSRSRSRDKDSNKKGRKRNPQKKRK